ncbi:response regulator [Streptomyces sp. NPDC059409]|uniref:response regulator n=1 Tax=Streptomyces sp. NPDC059409 TaxID=3346824 RepID=UPI00369EED31
MPGDIRVVIVDDQPLVRRGLRATLGPEPGIRVEGEAVNGREAVRMVGRLRPDVVLMDINMPHMNGLEATREICELSGAQDVRIVILTMYDEDEHVYEALRNGASGFIIKDSPPEMLAEAVRLAALGEALLSPSVTRRLIGEFARRPMLAGAAPDLDQLTDRELDVFKLLIRGFKNEDIAKMLVLGESTVKSHVQHLYQKLRVRDRVQIVIYAYENGLVQPGGQGPEYPVSW